jgi:NAD(P)-dependent dehydrogenase (short-subunit alcohol dehydrogenase family)
LVSVTVTLNSRSHRAVEGNDHWIGRPVIQEINHVSVRAGGGIAGDETLFPRVRHRIFRPEYNRGDYCVAKAALSMLTPLYAARLAEYGINVYEIRPDIIATDMTSSVREKYDKLIGEGLTPIKRRGTPDDIGQAVTAIAKDLLPFSTGEVINVDGGFHLRRL